MLEQIGNMANLGKRYLRGILMEEKGGEWSGSIGRSAFWCFLGLALGMELGTEGGPPEWILHGLWGSFGYNTATKIADAVKGFSGKS